MRGKYIIFIRPQDFVRMSVEKRQEIGLETGIKRFIKTLIITGEKIVENLHDALEALGDPFDYRVSLELMKSFGLSSETFGLAYFADVKPKLDKLVGAIVHSTLVSVEANTAAQKAAVLLLLTQDAEAYHKACVSAKDAAELLNDVLDISSTPQQTPQQTDEAVSAKGDTPMETEKAEKGDTPMETDVPEEPAGTDLGAVIAGDGRSHGGAADHHHLDRQRVQHDADH
jgi:hypothetical protein